MLQLLFGEKRFYQLLDSAGVQIRSCVIDTNVLINEARAASMRIHPPPLLQAAIVGTINFFATTVVRDEVPKVIREVAEEREFAPDPVLQAWRNTCAPLITFVDVTGLPQASAFTQRLAATYHPDVPTAQLVDLLDPDIFLTLDRKHFREFQIAPVPPLPPTDLARSPDEELRSLKVAVRDRSVGDALHLGIGVGGSVVVAGAFSAIGQLAKVVTQTLRRPHAPLAALGMATLAGGIWFAGRQCARESQHLRAERGDTGVGAVLGRALAALNTRMTARFAAEETIAAALREKTPARTGREYAARVLARSAAPTRLTWLARQMKAAGYTPRRLPLLRSVELQLRNHRRLFTSPLVGQWDIRSWPPPEEAKGEGSADTDAPSFVFHG